MAEPRRENQLMFRKRNDPTSKKPLSPRPQVSFRDKPELTRAVKDAARTIWPTARRFDVEIRGNWRECRGTVLVTFQDSAVEGEFAPVWDPSRSEGAQARPQQDAGKVAPQW